MEITDLVRRVSKQPPIAVEYDEEIPASIDGFDVAERISYIGMLRREIDALDFSTPILKTLFSDKKEEPVKKAIENQRNYLTDSIARTYHSSPFLRGGGTWVTANSPEVNTTIEQKSKILAGNILKAYDSHGLVPHDNDIDYIVEIIGYSLSSISNYAAIQPMQHPISQVYTMKLVAEEGNSSPRMGFELNAATVASSSRRLATACVEQSIPERMTNGLYEVEHGLIDLIRQSLRDRTVDLDANAPESLLISIQRHANQIGARNKRGTANSLMISSQFGGTLDYILSLSTDHSRSKSDTHSIDPKSTSQKYIKFIGTLFDNLKVYTSPHLERNEMLLYYKGNSETDAGLTYCPYVIYYESGSMINPVTFMPTIGTMTRAGHLADKIPDYYTRLRYV